MKRRGSWQINFIVRALTGMGSIFLVNQWMDYRNIPVSVGLNVLSFFVSGWKTYNYTDETGIS